MLTKVGQTLLIFAMPLLLDNSSQTYSVSVIEQQKTAISRSNTPEENARVWGQLGNTFFLNNQFQKAIVAYQKSDSLLPSDSAKIGLAQSYYKLAQSRSEELKIISQSERLELYQNTRNLKKMVKVSQERLKIEINNKRAKAIAYLRETKGKNHSAIKRILGWELGIISLKDLTKVPKLILEMPDSPEKVMLLIRASHLEPLPTSSLLKQAVAVSIQINDNNSLAQSHLALAQYYKQIHNFKEALNHSNYAQFYAQSKFNEEVLFSGHWLNAKIYQAHNKNKLARSQFEGADQSLHQLRGSINLKLDSEKIEKFYREYMSLLLNQKRKDDKTLKKIIEINRKLKIKQLETYYGFPCPYLENNESNTPQANSARITTIIEAQKTHLILELPDGKKKHYTININADQLNNIIKNWRQQIVSSFTNEYQENAKILYKWIIRPLQLDLKNYNIKKLVFNHDNLLRNIPMSALYDGQEHLIKQYAISNTLGINNRVSSSLKKNKPAFFGITIAREGNTALPNVGIEITSIQEKIGGKTFLNETFTENNLRTVLNQGYDTLHLATHSIFGGSAKTSFLLTYDKVLPIDDFANLLRNGSPLKLLVLSACETASGNKNSVLGIAGIGIQAGAQTTIGSLWTLPDSKNTVRLMNNFYGSIQERGEGKALQKAIIKEIENNTPVSNWASLILLEN